MLVSGPAASHVLGPWSGFADYFSLSLVAAVAPNLALFAMQQVRQHMHIGYRGRRGAHRMHNARFRVHADARLHPEVPLVALLRLVHLRVTLPARVLRRGGRMDNGGVHD